MRYIVTDRNGQRVNLGDEITDFRGDVAQFQVVSRGPEYNGTAKICYKIPGRNISTIMECYATVFDLTVVNIPESVTEAEQRIRELENDEILMRLPMFVAELARMRRFVAVRRFVADPDNFVYPVGMGKTF